MKRSILAMAVSFLLLWAGGAWASEIGIGAGVYGGLSWPVLQDVSEADFDLGENGFQFALRAPVALLSFLTLEPYYSSANYGDRTETFNGNSYTREGFDGKSYGVNALIGRLESEGARFYPYVGIGNYSLERTGEKVDEMGYNFGLGFGFHVATRVSVQIRSEFDMVVTGDTSRKFTSAMAGLNFDLKP